MNLGDMRPFLEKLANNISGLFGDNCEVAIHDLTKDYDHTIVFVKNGHVSGRKVGDGISESVLKAIHANGDSTTDNYRFLSRTQDGKVLKSSSIYIKDDEGKLAGLFAINYDITDLIMAERAIKNAISIDEPRPNEGIGTITTNVSDLLDTLIEQADQYVGMPVAMMGKQEKINAIHYLNDCGAFLIKKAGDKVSHHYNISKYTLYNYLGDES